MPRRVDDLLDGADPNEGFPHGLADALIAKFIAGRIVTVSRRRAEGVNLERLEGVDEVWALCFRQPRPGWRLLGRFLEQNVFVGFRLCDRHWLARNRHKQYEEEANRVILEWQALFGNIGPLRSQDLTDYLGEGFWNVDQDP